MDTTNINISELIAENERLKKENEELKEHLKKYTYSNSHKKYYETNKKQVMEKLANLMKIAWAGGKKAAYIFGDAGYKMLNIL